MPDHYFWLSDAQFARLQPLLPNKVRGVPRVDNRKVISGIIDVIRYGLMWRDAPAYYGPHKTLYKRFVRWSKAGVFDHIFQALAADSTATATVMTDSTHLKAHRIAASVLKKGCFRAASGAPEAGSTRNATPFAVAMASP
jgi:transposase